MPWVRCPRYTSYASLRSSQLKLQLQNNETNDKFSQYLFKFLGNQRLNRGWAREGVGEGGGVGKSRGSLSKTGYHMHVCHTLVSYLIISRVKYRYSAVIIAHSQVSTIWRVHQVTHYINRWWPRTARLGDQSIFVQSVNMNFVLVKQVKRDMNITLTNSKYPLGLFSLFSCLLPSGFLSHC